MQFHTNYPAEHLHDGCHAKQARLEGQLAELRDFPTTLHVHATREVGNVQMWGVFTPASDGIRMVAECGGEDAETNARLFARAYELRAGLILLWQLEAYPSPFYKRVKEMTHFLLHGVDGEGYGQDAADDVARALLPKEVPGDER